MHYIPQSILFFNVLSYREKGFNKSYTVCGGEQRTKNVYVSTSNIIEITLTEMSLDAGQFVIHYQGDPLHTRKRMMKVHVIINKSSL